MSNLTCRNPLPPNHFHDQDHLQRPPFQHKPFLDTFDINISYLRRYNTELIFIFYAFDIDDAYDDRITFTIDAEDDDCECNVHADEAGAGIELGDSHK